MPMARQSFVCILAIAVLLAFSWTRSLKAIEVHGEEHKDVVMTKRNVMHANDKNKDTNVEKEEVAVPQNLCGYKSKTFSGQCVNRRSCEYQCRVVEHAVAGACHFHHIQRHCYCYHYC